MGGIAVVIDWERSTRSQDLDPMLALIPHRSAGGVGRGHFEHAALGEARSATDPSRDPTITTVGHLSIVGALRLWDRDALRSRAGGDRATSSMDDRRLLLEAYRRNGIGFLDDVDGDYAFVIWDDKNRQVLAVRDRFGVKPLFYERTKDGLRIASEPKQLVVTSTRPPTPNEISVAEYLTRSYRETRHSFFSGINRIRPSSYLLVSPSRFREVRHWTPMYESVPPPPARDVAAGFRNELVNSVRNRRDTATAVVSQLSGGLDSSSIAAAASLNSRPASTLTTVSAVFPGRPNDESAWIDAIVERQSFPHRDFTPQIEDIDQYDADMWKVDGPRVNAIRGMWTEPMRVALESHADLVMTGRGGDEVLYQGHLIADLLRAGSLPRWVQAVRADAAWYGHTSIRAASRSVRRALPMGLKSAVLAVARRQSRPAETVLPIDLARLVRETSPEEYRFDLGFPSRTQNLLTAYTRAPILILGNEIDEAVHAYHGLEVTHPYLDRSLVEYVASILPQQRPIDGSSKTLVRVGFNGLLPKSVLDRRHKTAADSYLDVILRRLGPEYRAKYPSVTEAARTYVDANRYNSLLTALDNGAMDISTREQLWRTWMLMAWLDGLVRYRATSVQSPAI